MKIKTLKIKNFAKFTDFEIEFNGNVTKLIGLNGSGKSTVGITGIWACLKGIAEKSRNGQLIGERFRFIGNAKASADIELTLIDQKKNAEINIKNHITKQGNLITFQAPDNYPISNEWLNGLLNTAFISPKNFAQLNGKEQALRLGINTSNYDSEMKELKSDYTHKNKMYRAFGELTKVEKTEPVNILDLYKKKDDIITFNRVQEEVRGNKSKMQEEINNIESQIKKFQEDLEKSKEHFKSLPEPQEKKSFNYILEKINTAQSTNDKANEYQNHLRKKGEKNKLLSELKLNKESQSKLEQKKIDYIKSFNFNFKGLFVDDDGKLLLDGRPIKEPYFSRGELAIIVAKLHTSLTPELKYIFLDDFESFDTENQEKIINYLLGLDFQIVTAEVGNEGNSDNTVLLKECSLVESYEEPIKQEALL